MKECLITECMIHGAKIKAREEGRTDVLNTVDRWLCHSCPLGFEVGQSVRNIPASISEITESYQRFERQGYHPGSRTGR